MNTTKIEIEYVTIERLEGYHHELRQQHTFPSLSAANSELAHWSLTVGRGYHKCQYAIVFADGFIYRGRYDLEPFTKAMPDLKNEILEELTYLATSEKIKNYEIYRDLSKKAEKILTNYQLT